MRLTEIVDELTKEGHEVIVSGDTCFGACDIKEGEAKALGCEKIIHYGHTKFMDTNILVEYREVRENINPKEILEKNYERLDEFKKIGLVSSLQFIDTINIARDFLEGKGKEVFIGDCKHVEKKLYAGQILGCDVSNAKIIENKVECFLHIGSGRFHALGLDTDKPVFVLDVEKSKICAEQDLPRLFEKQRYVAQASAKDAKSFGILVSSKKGQMNIKLAEKIKEKICSLDKVGEAANIKNIGTKRNCRTDNIGAHGEIGRSAYIIIMDEIKPEKLLGVKVDCFINTACPRIAIDNRTEFDKPFLNWDEICDLFEIG